MGEAARTMAESSAARRGRERATAEPYHKGNVKAGLVEAARRLLESDTIESITARRLCRDVGVSSANFYNHFESLEHLFMEVAADGFSARAAENRRILRRGGSREEMLIQIVWNTVEFAVAEPQTFALMFGRLGDVSLSKRVTRGADESFSIIVQIIYGEDRYSPEDPAQSHETCAAAYAFLAFMYGLARCYSQGLIANTSGTKAERRRFTEALARKVIAGVLA